jgi:hypothetical protein
VGLLGSEIECVVAAVGRAARQDMDDTVKDVVEVRQNRRPGAIAAPDGGYGRVEHAGHRHLFRVPGLLKEDGESRMSLPR